MTRENFLDKMVRKLQKRVKELERYEVKEVRYQSVDQLSLFQPKPWSQATLDL